MQAYVLELASEPTANDCTCCARDGFLADWTCLQMVKESLNDGYCDISGLDRDLVHIGDAADLPVYLAQGE